MHTFVVTKDVFCRDKYVFVATKLCLSQQTKYFRNKMFVTTNILLLRKKTCFVANKDVYRREKYVFVATTITVVVAPATDSAARLSVYGYMMNTHSDRQRVQLRNAATTRRKTHTWKWDFPCGEGIH